MLEVADIDDNSTTTWSWSVTATRRRVRVPRERRRAALHEASGSTPAPVTGSVRKSSTRNGDGDLEGFVAKGFPAELARVPGPAAGVGRLA
jgi:hypothetical protein